jgi:hypothetical protein
MKSGAFLRDEEIRTYLDDLERTKFLAAPDPEMDIDDPDDEIEDEPWLENSVTGAEESLTRTTTSTVTATSASPNQLACAPLPIDRPIIDSLPRAATKRLSH